VRAAARDVISCFPGRKITVVGDVMLDQFVHGRVTRISPEAPVPVVQFTHEDIRLGGAANVAHNLRAYGAAVRLVGVIGRDEHGTRVRELARSVGIDVAGLVACDRPTTRKMRVVTTRNQQVARVDYEDDADAEGALEDLVLAQAAAAVADAQAIVVSDYLKGAITRRLMRLLVDAAGAREVPLLVDPKIPHIDHYAGVSVITPNHVEAETATAMRIRSDEDARLAARAFRARAGCQSVLITRGEHGMWMLDGSARAGGDHDIRELALPAAARDVSDVTGAGDTVIATLAVASAAGAPLAVAARLANEAAGVSVARFGPVAVSREELLDALDGRVAAGADS
jgi:D-beta-D-heptose 7-phosphate kinase/D-beta-D-heptose 1-phosphate adenosyltransferase